MGDEGNDRFGAAAGGGGTRGELGGWPEKPETGDEFVPIGLQTPSCSARAGINRPTIVTMVWCVTDDG